MPSRQLTQQLQRHAVWFFALYLVAAIFAFWPRYLSDLGSVANGMVHFHGAVLACWLLILVVQAALIRTGNRAQHRLIGRWSIAVAPFVVVSILLAVHVSLNRNDELTSRRLLQFAMQCGSAVMFAMFYALAIRYRRDTARHARWMFCTVLTMTSPVFDRVLAFQAPALQQALPMFPDGSRVLPVIHVLLLTLAALDWRASRQAGPFFGAWAAFAAAHGFALMSAGLAWWGKFATWFRALPLS